jgi:transcriptional regulator with PAS, ATPase and Fis domain
LRERKDDIHSLLNTFIAESSAGFEKSIPNVSNTYFKLLMSYNWPGNIRELKNAVQYSIARMGDKDVQLLPSHLNGFFPTINETVFEPAIEKLGKNLPEIEKKIILMTLKSCGGNKSQTAKNLGISRATLYRKLQTT